MRVFISILVYLGFIALELNGIESGELNHGCALDVLVGLMSPLSFTFMTIVPIIMLNHLITEKDFKYQFVLRCRSWRSILRGQIAKTAIASLAMAAFLLVAVILFSFSEKLPLYNWDSFDSIFFIRTDQRLELQGFTVYFYSLICIALRIIMMQNILLLFMWGCKYKIIGIVSVLCISFDEAIRGDRLICRLISFDYDIWLSQFNRMRLPVQTAVYLCIGILLYQWILSRKELLHCE